MPAQPIRVARIRRRLACASAIVLACVLAVGPRAAQAQAWPSKPIRIVVGVPAGSGADLAARRVAEGLARDLGVPVLVDNRPGADGVLAVGQVTAAPADGSTLLWGLGSQIAVNPATMPGLPYDPARDLTPISLVAYQPLLLAVHPSVPAATIAELVAYTRQRPGTVDYASGTGTFMLAAESIKLQTGADMQHIPYTGSLQALNALVAGTVEVAMLPGTTSLGPAQTGRIRVLAVSGAERLPQLARAPTFTEAGLVDEVPVWSALFAPAGTPAAVVDRLYAALLRTAGTPESRAKALEEGNVIALGGPDALRAVVARDIALVAALAKKIGYVPGSAR